MKGKKVFLVDNFDSFTMNVYHLFSELTEHITVKRADKTNIEEIKRENPDLIILSPGPGKPEDAELSLKILKEFDGKKTVFGICLGMQCMAVYKKGKVDRLSPVHGKKHKVFHKGETIFKNIPSPFFAARYHSLAVFNLNDMEVIATTEDNIIMGIQNKKSRFYGVQFHPESFLTEYGLRIAENVLNLC